MKSACTLRQLVCSSLALATHLQYTVVLNYLYKYQTDSVANNDAFTIAVFLPTATINHQYLQ